MKRGGREIGALFSFYLGISIACAPPRSLMSAEPVLVNLPPPSLTEQVLSQVWQMGGPLLNSSAYSKPRGDVAVPGEMFNPFLQGRVTAGAPLVHSFTRSASPGRSVVLSGARFTTGNGDDTRVWLFSQTSANNGSALQLQPITKSDTSLTFVVPDQLPNTMYFVWVQNADGVSTPVRINAAEIWWTGPNRTAPGQEISVYGRNLSTAGRNNASYAVVRPWDSPPTTPSVAFQLASATPYHTRWRLPQTLPLGKYELWLHNGHGGAYGWSGPVPLTVDSPSAHWKGTTIDVTSYGASPSDSGDDTAAVERALREARDHQTVFFPAGHYRLSRPLTVPSAISMEGAAAGGSVIEFVNGSGLAGSALRIQGFPSRLRNLTIVGTLTQGLPHETALVRFDGRFRPTPEGLIVENIRCLTPGDQLYSCISVEYVNSVSIKKNTFETPSALFIKRSHQVFVQDNVFAGNWTDAKYSPLSAIGLSASNAVDISNNRAYSIDRAAAKTLSRFVVVQGHSHGMATANYIGSNRIDRVGCAQETCGENILLETPGALFTGSPAQVDGLTLRFDQVNWEANTFDWDNPGTFEPPEKRHPSLLAIQSGAGEGQYRRILNTTKDTLTIDYAWDVAPDTSSVVSVITGTFRNAIVGNAITGWPGALLNTHTTNVGIQSYGATLDSIIQGNSISTLNRGIELSSLVNASCGKYVSGRPEGTSGSNCPTWNNVVEQNSIADTQSGIASWTRVEVPTRNIAGPAMLGNVIRDNVVQRSTRSGITIGDINKFHKADQWQLSAVVEHNRVQEAPLHIELLGLQAVPLIRGNSLMSDTEGAVGVRIERGVETPYVCQNAYVGAFAATIQFASRGSTADTHCLQTSDFKRR